MIMIYRQIHLSVVLHSLLNVLTSSNPLIERHIVYKIGNDRHRDRHTIKDDTPHPLIMLLVFLDPLVLIDIGVLPWVLFSHLVALLFTSFHEEHKECEG